jgi:hypothetical protein
MKRRNSCSDATDDKQRRGEYLALINNTLLEESERSRKKKRPLTIRDVVFARCAYSPNTLTPVTVRQVMADVIPRIEGSVSANTVERHLRTINGAFADRRGNQPVYRNVTLQSEEGGGESPPTPPLFCSEVPLLLPPKKRVLFHQLTCLVK